MNEGNLRYADTKYGIYPYANNIIFLYMWEFGNAEVEGVNPWSPIPGGTGPQFFAPAWVQWKYLATSEIGSDRWASSYCPPEGQDTVIRIRGFMLQATTLGYYFGVHSDPGEYSFHFFSLLLLM
jgi:hypothetical protein